MSDVHGSDNSGNSDGSNAANFNGSQDGGVAWTAGLQNEDNRAKVEAKGWKSMDDMVSSYSHLESQLGKNLTVPGKDATPEQWDGFYKATGRPDIPDRYDFSMPEGLPDNHLYDQDLATNFKNWAHGSGLNPRQADALHGSFVKHMADQQVASQSAQGEAVEKAHEAITAKWGPTDGDKYKRNVELADRAARKLGLHEVFTESGLLSHEGAVVNDTLAFALAQVGQAMFAEDSLHGTSADTVNPWSEESENLSKQGEILRNDPEKAKAMIVAAGLDPASFGLAT